MHTWTVLALMFGGVIIGALAASAGWRLTYAARTSAWATERELLRERLADLELSVSEDRETAATLSPLRDALGRVERQVEVLERDRTMQYGSLRETLTRVENHTQELGRATSALAGSLHASTTRGAWGEVQLRRVLEVSGMLAHCDFEEQERLQAPGGQPLRPDVVVHLPGNRSLVIDAKAPMTNFLRAQGEKVADHERAALLDGHAAALRRHVTALAGKEYWAALPLSPEFVICFLPTDAMLGAALAAAPDLHEEALRLGVVLVGPGGLLGLLRAVALGWRQDALASGAKELLDLGQELYRRLSTLGGHTTRLARSLTSSVEAYNAMVGALESRVLVSARRFRDLDLVAEDIPPVPAMQAGPRPMTAAELIDALDPGVSRPDLDFDVSPSDPSRASRDAG
ncbi:MAG: DNA recombination protein RmuC [Nostocoides sp.]